MIESKVDIINKMNTKRLFIFSGIDEYGTEQFHLIEPHLANDMFYYNCGSKFVTDIFDKYYDNYNGSIIFVNGDECLIYKFDSSKGKFEVHKAFNSQLMGKTRQGGSSQGRYMRIVDNSRKSYISKLIENINQLNKIGNWIFGSKDITDDINERKNELRVNLGFGGYIEFDKTTILDTKRWIPHMKNATSNNAVLDQIVTCIETSPDLLNFGNKILDNIELYEYIVVTQTYPKYKQFKQTDKVIKLLPSDKHYSKLKDFGCIGKYYYSGQQQQDQELSFNHDFDDVGFI